MILNVELQNMGAAKLHQRGTIVRYSWLDTKHIG